MPFTGNNNDHGLGPCENLDRGKLPASWMLKNPLLAASYAAAAAAAAAGGGSSNGSTAAEGRAVAAKLRRFVGKLEPKRDGQY